MILCPNCKGVLVKGINDFYCDRNHRFDISKSGYINLLLNHSNSGDNRLMVNARKTILNAGYFKPLLDKVIEIIKNENINSLLDLGCGEGYYSRNIKQDFDIDIYGVDISKEAINAAAKQSKEVMYIVSNIYDLPFPDHCFDAIINIFAPHSLEINRTIRKLYIKVVPGPNHLIELKEALYKDVYIKEDDVLDIDGLTLINQLELGYHVYVKEIEELFMMTPYYYKTDLQSVSLKSMDISMDFRIYVYHI